MIVVVTDYMRQAVAKAFMGQGSVPVPAYVAFGTGGHAPGDVFSPIPPSPSDTALEAEVIRKPITGMTLSGLTVTVTGALDNAEANGYVITEVGVLDASGKLLGRQTFKGIGKEATVKLEEEIQFLF